MATIKKLGTCITEAQIIQYRDTNNKKIRANIKDAVKNAITLFKDDIDTADTSEPILSEKAKNYFGDENNFYVFSADEINRFINGKNPQHLEFQYLMMVVGSLPAANSSKLQGDQTVVLGGCSKVEGSNPPRYVFSVNGVSLQRQATEFYGGRITLNTAMRFMRVNRKIKLHTRVYTTDAVKLIRKELEDIEMGLCNKSLNYLNNGHNAYLFDREDLNRFLQGDTTDPNPNIKFEHIMIIVGSLPDDEEEKLNGEQTIVIAGCSRDPTNPENFVFADESGQKLKFAGTEHPPRIYKTLLLKNKQVEVVELTPEFLKVKKNKT